MNTLTTLNAIIRLLETSDYSREEILSAACFGQLGALAFQAGLDLPDLPGWPTCESAVIEDNIDHA